MEYAGGGIVEEKRGKQLASARRKLSNFRSQRGSDQSSTSSTHSPFSFPVHPTLPLTTEHHENVAHPIKPVASPKGKEKALALEEECTLVPAPKMDGHKRVGSMGHRRRPSSISLSHPSPAVPFRNVSGLYDFSPAPTTLPSASFTGAVGGHDEGLDLPSYPSDTNIIAPVAPPPVAAGTAVNFGSPRTPENPEDDTVRARFTGFSFGSKPPAPSPRGQLGLESRRERIGRTSSPGHSPKPSLSAPGSLNRLSTPLSRPPSLLVTRPTPLFQDAPLGSAPPLQAPISPTSPPHPARMKRHSHTRSNSISLPNLKLGRPQSYNVLNSSPSFPQSPVSPDEFPPPNRVANGRKLKFEPSGRGAEAEKQRDESRRKALEKLTGKSPTLSPPEEVPTAEISLPDEEDEEESASPYMAQLEAESFGTQYDSFLPAIGASGSNALPGSVSPSDASPISPQSTPFSWTSPSQPAAPAEQWTYGGNRDREEGLGGLGFGLDLANSKRASMPSVLEVLTEEEEESEEVLSRGGHGNEPPALESLASRQSEEIEIPVVAPTPSRLRELHLVSSSVHVSPSRSEDSSQTVNRPLSESTPSKAFGTGSVGRRPRPLSGLGAAAFSAHGSSASSPSTNTTIATPKSASSLIGRRRPQPGSGSRGSSISYKKEKEDRGSSGSSREWTFGRNTSPSPTLGEFGSPPPISASAQFATWPKPRSSIDNDRTATLHHSQPFGMGIDMMNRGEQVEEILSPQMTAGSGSGSGSRWSRHPIGFTGASTEDESVGRESMSLDESSSFSWRDSRLELEMERDAFKEDAELWKTRCLAAEENLRAEKVESGVLWERVRKLGDRLSSVSSSHLPLSTQSQANEDSRLLGEMRNQLFSLTSLLEREQREKKEALSQVAYLEKELDELRYRCIPPPAVFQPVLPSHAFNNLNPNSNIAPIPTSATTLSAFGPPSPIITPPTPLPSSPNPDANGSRMKSWGFPSSRSTTPPKEKRRESFFGLSSVLRRPSIPEEEAGIDLPPIAFGEVFDDRHPDSYAPADAPAPAAVPMARSTSMTSSASSVVSFLSGYLGRNKPPSSAFAGDELRRGVLDLRGGCKCCTGDVIEL